MVWILEARPVLVISKGLIRRRAFRCGLCDCRVCGCYDVDSKDHGLCEPSYSAICRHEGTLPPDQGKRAKSPRPTVFAAQVLSWLRPLPQKQAIPIHLHQIELLRTRRRRRHPKAACR
jgi:hypothetical protein